jgi:type I restriction enzyme S subunit
MKNYYTYRDYKDSGVQWLGNIPSDWDVKKVKHLFQIVKRIAGELGHDVLSITQNGIKVKDVESGGGQLSMDYSKYQFVEKGDFGMNHMDLLTGYVDISKYDGVMSPDYRVFRLNDKWCDPRYLLYLFQKGYWDRLFFHLGHGSSELGRWRLPTDEFKLFKLPVPPQEEQTAIANYLDKKTTEIKEFIALKEKTITLLKERKMAIINNLVTGKTVWNGDAWAEPAEVKDSGIEWLGEIPKHWEVIPVKRLVKVKITDGPHETPTFVDDGIPFLSADAVKNGKLDFSRKRGYIDIKTHNLYCKKVKPQKGDIFIVKSGSTTGNPCIVDTDVEFSIWSPLALIRVNDVLIYNVFAFLAIQSIYFQRQVQDKWSFGTQPNIGMGVIENLLILKPTLKEQFKIIESITPELQKYETLIAQALNEIELIREYQQSLISEVVTGKMDLRGN